MELFGFFLLFILLSMIVLAVWSIVLAIKKHRSSTKTMLLGISLILFGGLMGDSFVDLTRGDIGGIEYFIMLFGLVLSIIGFARKDN